MHKFNPNDYDEMCCVLGIYSTLLRLPIPVLDKKLSKIDLNRIYTIFSAAEHRVMERLENCEDDARIVELTDELARIRKAVDVFVIMHRDRFP